MIEVKPAGNRKSSEAPWFVTFSQVNSVVLSKCRLTSATVAARVSRSNSARESTRLVLKLVTKLRVAKVRSSLVSQPVQVMPDMLRMTRSFPWTPFSASAESLSVSGNISWVAANTAGLLPAQQESCFGSDVPQQPCGTTVTFLLESPEQHPPFAG